MTPTVPELIVQLHDAVVRNELDATMHALRAAARAHAPLLPLGEIDVLTTAVLARVHGLGPLEPLVGDPSITDIMVNGAGPVWIERRGRVEATSVVLDTATIELLIERITAPLGLRVDRRTPMGDGRLADGSRIHVAVPPAAIDGPYLTIRRFGATTIPLHEFAPVQVAEQLIAAVRARRSILVVGGTGSGKTTLLNALCQHLDTSERVLTVEDAAELRIPGDHVVRLEARTASADGVGAVTIRELVRNALRMRPDRIIVGEVRGAEALDMVQAMHTGHDGSLATCHANTPSDALGRLETMMLTADADIPIEAVRAQLCAAIDVIVQVRRAPGGAREIAAVHEVDPDPDARPRTTPKLPGDAWVRRPRRTAA